MLLERYGSIKFVNKLLWRDGIKLINKALEKRNEQREWELYVSVYSNMDKETFVSFDKFRGIKSTNKPIKKGLTKEQILEKAEEIMKIHQGTHEGIKKD